MRLTLKKNRGTRLIIRGQLCFAPWLGGSGRTSILLGERATLEIAGDFGIGDGVRISLGRESRLHFGGRKAESASGITCDATVLVQREVRVGSDFICAWGLFITDSDWHHIEGQEYQSDVVIGDGVWVAQGATVLKGTSIASGCIVASQCVVHKQIIPANCLVAGNPARVVKTPVKWSRDFPQNHS